MDAPDIVYVVRADEQNDSLRYSLRSLGHLPHRRVFIAGCCPGWVQNVTRVPVQRLSNKFTSIEENLRAALDHEDVGEHIVYFNDDFYVAQPVDEVPMMHGGTARHYGIRQELGRRYAATLQELGIAKDLLTYEIHVPLPVHTEDLRSRLRVMPKGLLWRTWYGNSAQLGGIEVKDVKSRDGSVIEGPFISSSARILSDLRPYLDDVLPRMNSYA